VPVCEATRNAYRAREMHKWSETTANDEVSVTNEEVSAPNRQRSVPNEEVSAPNRQRSVLNSPVSVASCGVQRLMLSGMWKTERCHPRMVSCRSRMNSAHRQMDASH
jgi:hypothetical protein